MLNLHNVLICLSSLYPCYSTSLSVLALSLLFDLALCPRSISLFSSSLQGRLSPFLSDLELFRPIPPHIFFHEQYSAEGWPSLASVDQGSKTKCMRPRSYVTQGYVRVRPRRCVSPRTLALPPSDWQDSWASEGHAFDIKTLVWLETGIRD